MLTNYLKTALRNLIKHKTYTSTNVLGLAVGMACCLMTLLYVRDELSYDRFHEKADQVYRVNATSHNPEGDFYRTSIPPPIAPALQAEYPEVEAVTRVNPMSRRLLRVGDEVYQEDRVYLAEASFFDVFTFPLRRGDPETALAVPGTVILTETTARRYFGDTDPLGQIINYEKSIDLTVVGIVDDAPSNSHLQFDGELLKILGVQAVSFSSDVPNAVRWSSTGRWEGVAEDEALQTNHIMVDFDFMDLYGFDLVAGRGFSRTFPGDATAAYVLNEAAIQAIGWDDPIRNENL